jgi:predicted amidohydrolase YtcJ
VLGKDENLSKIDALRAYTSAAAVLLRDEARIGTLAVGKAADITVLDSDILSGDATAINAAKVLLTLKDGKVVYGDAAR